jgi:cyclase
MIDAPVVPAVAAVWQHEIEHHGRLLYIINSEPHIDHFGGSAFFSGTVVAHDKTADRIRATPLEEMTRMLEAGTHEIVPLPETFRFHLPTVTFSENLTLYVGNHTFRIIMMPGHTTCQVVVYIPEERVLFAADTITNRIMPSLYEALPFDWLDSLDRLRDFDIDFIVPGHGAIGSSGLVGEMADALRTAIEVVEKAVNEGMSLKEAKDRITVFSDYGDFITGPGFRGWLNRVNVGRLYEIIKGRVNGQ